LLARYINLVRPCVLNVSRIRNGAVIVTFSKGHPSFLSFYIGFLLLFAGATAVAFADPIPARSSQGATHGFLLLKGVDGKVIAVGDFIQTAHEKDVSARLIFRFRDGSVDDETTVFRQGRSFQLISDHHIQKGPSFPKPLDLSIDSAKSEVTCRETKDGAMQARTEHIDLPDDLANGLVSLALQNAAPDMAETKVSYLVASPKPRIVKLSMKPESVEAYSVGGKTRQAKRYRIHIELGGVAGVVAPIIGKQPSDIDIWVADGEVPTVMRTEGALYEGGPIWTIVQTAPTWLSASPHSRNR
jgi:hypothetical protein